MFALTADHLAVRDMAKSFADERLAPNALRWDETEHFPADVLREAAALGMAAIYVGEQHGGSGMTRLDAAADLRGFVDRRPVHRSVPVDPQHGRLGDRRLRLAGAEKPLSAPPRQHGADRQLLPDRARSGLRRRRADHPRPARRRRLCDRRRQAVHLRRRRQRPLSRHGAHRRGGAKRDFRLPGRERRPGPELRGEREKNGMAGAADLSGDPGGRARSGGQPGWSRKASASELPWPGSTAGA